MSTAPPRSPWWMAHVHADRRPFLAARGRIKKAIRAWFEAEGFTEVETGCLQVSPGNETHLHAFRTRLLGTDLSERDLYLHTSPEFAMKKLLAAGEERIFTFAPVFRNRERGALHGSEFTMLEWYRTDPAPPGAAPQYHKLWEDCARIVEIAARESGRGRWHWKDRSCDARRAPEVVTVEEAFDAYAGMHLFEEAFLDGRPDRAAFAEAARRIGIRIAGDDTWSDIFSRILVERIEPRLGQGNWAAPGILDGYPISEAALARPNPVDPRVAERFELYACGVELANGFGELTDPDQQRRRFETDMAEKERIYGERYPVDEDFLAALAHMPPASGCALGFDRLVMLATGASSLDQVIWTPMADWR